MKKEICENIFNYTIENYKRIDALIYNASILKAKRIENLNYNDIINSYNTNITSLIYITSLCLNSIKEQNGRFIFISSSASTGAIKGWSNYCSTKAAVNHFSRCLALEEKDIISICISPVNNYNY